MERQSEPAGPIASGKIPLNDMVRGISEFDSDQCQEVKSDFGTAH